MKNCYYVFISLIFLIIFSLPENLFSQKDTKRIPLSRFDFMLTLNDGIQLDCTKFIPDISAPPGGWPAVVFCHGYGGKKEDYIPDAIDQSSYGYYSLCYSMRGQGRSTGQSNLISTIEMNDFIQIVEYVKAENIVNPDLVGAMGASQGGTIPMMACCNGLNLKCVVSDVSAPDFATNWIENNCVKMTLLWSLSYQDTTVRYAPQVKSYRNWILLDTPDKWDSLAYYIPLNRDFEKKLLQNNTPFLAGMCWQDKFFNPNGFLNQIYKINVPYRMYLGTYDAHGADSAASECDFYDYICGEWADYWLLNEPNHSLDSSKYIYASSVYPRQNNKWTWKRFYSDTYPPTGTENIKFYFQPDGRLSNDAIYNNPTDKVNFLNDVKDTTLTMLEAVNREFTGSVFETKFGKTQLLFDSKPLLSDTRMIGTPFVNIHYSSSANKVQFNLQVWEVKPDGTGDIVTRANYTDRKITPNVKRLLKFSGTSSSHIFKQGNRIRVIITNLDNISDDPFLRTNPHVLPSLVKANNLIYLNSSNLSYIQLPLIDFLPISVHRIPVVIPGDFKLEQVYPNSYKTDIKIKFNLPRPVQNKVSRNATLIYDVQMKVSDASGKEIMTLVNEKLTPGSYEVSFNTGTLSTGIYYYRITANGFKDVKKMILLK